jgi:hypothetical protein
VGGFQGLVHDAGQVIADRVQGDRVFQSARERGHSLVGVIPGPVAIAAARPAPPATQPPAASGTGQPARVT